MVKINYVRLLLGLLGLADKYFASKSNEAKVIPVKTFPIGHVFRNFLKMYICLCFYP